MPTNQQIMDALSGVMDPELHRNIVDLNMVRDLKIDPKGRISFTLTLTIPSCPLRNQISSEAERVLKAVPGVNEVVITFGSMTDEERRALFGKKAPLYPQLAEFNKIENTVAIMSGKGGVGKSSVTALMAVSLARQGKKVGILDADITGPSIPKLFGLPAGGLRSGEQGMLPAVTCLGIRVVSVNLLLKSADTAVIWRGPMISSAIQQFWNDTLWGKLDYLLVDLPPGTSDAALTVLQSLPLKGVVLVTTPQELATLVVRKAMSMLAQLNIPILSVVENMSTFRCPDCGSTHELFGPSHIEEIQKMLGGEIPVTRIPIVPGMAEKFDSGNSEEIEIPEMDLLLPALIQGGLNPA